MQDPSLSNQLMRFINSAAVALPARVTSIHRAVIYMGLSVVKRWVSLMVLASIEDKPSELTRFALGRAAGAALSGALCWERAHWDAVPDHVPDIALSTLSELYLDAVQWAGEAAAAAS